MAREAATLPVTRRRPDLGHGVVCAAVLARQVLGTGMIVALVGGGWIAWQALALPRL